jgi:hypothetical protein
MQFLAFMFDYLVLLVLTLYGFPSNATSCFPEYTSSTDPEVYFSYTESS